MVIVKAKKIKLAAGRISDFQCPKDNAQAFLWCDDPLGLGVRSIATGAKSYIFQSKVKGQSMRITIGDVNTWNIADAQKEARRLQTIIDMGNDPRQVKADKEAAKVAAKLAKEAEAAVLAERKKLESVTVETVWNEYVIARKTKWSADHLHKHERAMQKAGQPQKRGKGLTVAGELESLANVRLIDLAPELVAYSATIRPPSPCTFGHRFHGNSATPSGSDAR